MHCPNCNRDIDLGFDLEAWDEDVCWECSGKEEPDMVGPTRWIPLNRKEIE